jgi:hypothetical protein
MNNAQLINQTSGEVEYYTPLPIIEVARATMGGIDLDPASSFAANMRVCANVFYSSEGEKMRWFGRVWLNHPFGRVSNPVWIDKLVLEWESQSIIEACCITYACTSENWFQPLLRFPQCFLTPRTNYYLPDGTLKRGVSKGSVVTYLGKNPWGFIQNFKSFGVIKEAVDGR